MYQITTPRGTYELEANGNIETTILAKENITYKEIEETGKFILLAQGDKKWKNVKIGKSNVTVGGYGCLITSLAMFSSWYGLYKDPAWLAKNLSFTGDGSLYWNSITTSDLPFKFVWRAYSKNNEEVTRILMSEDSACAMEVVLSGGMHWCALVGYDARRGYKVADPYYNDYCYVNERYGGYTGYAEIIRK